MPKPKSDRKATDRPASGRGVFITFEGGEGAGKSTHIRFLAQALESQGYQVLCLREPGGTAIGEALRDVVLDLNNDAMDVKTELLIYEAARAQIVEEVIKPALAAGTVVLCDRFYDSTVAYQSFGRGLPRALIDDVNAFATDGLVPDRTILLMAGSVEDGLERATHHAPADRLESAGADFHRRVNGGFRVIASEDPGRIRLIESSDTKSRTSALIFENLEDLFPFMADDSIINESFFSSLDIPSERKLAEMALENTEREELSPTELQGCEKPDRT